MRITSASAGDKTDDLRVFVAEDSRFIRVRIVTLLTGCVGVQCVGWAEGVNDAITGIRDTHPHGLILDLQLLDGSGLDVLHAARCNDPALRVVVCTNWATDQHRAACRTAGAECVLDKSTEFTQLRNVVLRWADARDSSHPSFVH